MGLTLSASTGIPGAVELLLLRGLDTITGEQRKSALDGQVVISDASASVTISMAKSELELRRSMSIDQSASVEGSVASVSQKMQFASSFAMTASSFALIVRATVTAGVYQCVDPTIRSDAKFPARDAKDGEKELAPFVQTYGDSYVSSVALGSEYVAVYMFYTETVTEQEALANSVSGSGTVSGMKISAAVSTVSSSFSKTSSTRSDFKQYIAGIEGTDLPSIDMVEDFALKFAKILPKVATVTSYAVKGYDTLPEANAKAMKKLVANRLLFNGSPDNPGASIKEKRAAVLAVQNGKNAIQQVYDFYGYRGDPDLGRLDALISQDLESVRNALQRYKNAPLDPPVPIEWRSLKMGAPSLSFTSGTSPLWGSGGGVPYTLAPYSATGVTSVLEAVYRRGRLKTLAMFGDAFVTQLVLAYEQDGKQQALVSYGRGGGRTSLPLVFDAGQCPVQLGAKVGKVIDNLVVNKVKGVLGVGAGGAGGTYAEWTLPANSFFLGFNLTADKYIDSIQAVYVTFQPATFTPVR